eukprot:364786-Chlamydomonas_euryale.AAC.26
MGARAARVRGAPARGTGTCGAEKRENPCFACCGARRWFAGSMISQTGMDGSFNKHGSNSVDAWVEVRACAGGVAPGGHATLTRVYLWPPGVCSLNAHVHVAAAVVQPLRAGERQQPCRRRFFACKQGGRSAPVSRAVDHLCMGTA